MRLGSQIGEHSSQLDGDVARPHDDRLLRQMLQFEEPVRVNSVLGTRNRRDSGET